jgi:beta-mannosidase
MYPHRIRLRGPWECEPLARMLVRPDGGVETLSGPLPAACRMTMPCRWNEGGLGDFAGRVRFRRRFGYPGRIDAHERVWLTFAGVDAVAEAHLNGHSLGRHQVVNRPFEFEVTALLQARNELIVDVEAPSGNGGLWGEVALEVRLATDS